MKKIFYVLAFKIPLIKKWYIGNEYLKNSPTVIMVNPLEIDGLKFTNTCLKVSENSKVSNCSFQYTLKLSQYF